MLVGHAFNPSTEEVEARLLMKSQDSQCYIVKHCQKKWGGGMAGMLVQWKGKEERTPGQTGLHGEPQDTQGYIPRPPCLKTLTRKKRDTEVQKPCFQDVDFCPSDLYYY